MSNKKEIISEISSDLKIYRLKEEESSIYSSRVIYSALAEWIKISTLNCDILNCDTVNIGQSRKYLSSRAKIFLENMTELFPEIHEWFHPEDSVVNPESVIVDRLKNSGEIIKPGFDTHLALPSYEECVICNMMKVTRGIENNEMHMYTGLTKLKSIDNNYEIDKKALFEFYGIENQMAIDVWNIYTNNAEWRKREYITCQIFNKYSKVNFYRSWEDNYKLKEGDISIYKENHGDFGVIKKVRGEIYTSQFNSSLLSEYEIRRFMYAIKYDANNSAVVNYKYLSEKSAVELNLKSALPNHENSILLALGWPKNSIQDNTNLIFSIHVWEFIKLILENLNIVIREID